MSDLSTLQQKLGVPSSASYDAKTQAAVVKLQLQLGLPATGEPDPATMAGAGLYDPGTAAPPLDGKSTLGRDLVTSMNQIPGWAWLALASAGGLLAYLAYRTANKKS